MPPAQGGIQILGKNTDDFKVGNFEVRVKLKACAASAACTACAAGAASLGRMVEDNAL